MCGARNKKKIICFSGSGKSTVNRRGRKGEKQKKKTPEMEVESRINAFINLNKTIFLWEDCILSGPKGREIKHKVPAFWGWKVI